MFAAVPSRLRGYSKVEWMLLARELSLEPVGYGLLVGGGLEFDVGGRGLIVGARYDHSLGNITEEADARHRVISVLATFEFPGGISRRSLHAPLPR